MNTAVAVVPSRPGGVVLAPLQAGRLRAAIRDAIESIDQPASAAHEIAHLPADASAPARPVKPTSRVRVVLGDPQPAATRPQFRPVDIADKFGAASAALADMTAPIWPEHDHDTSRPPGRRSGTFPHNALPGLRHVGTKNEQASSPCPHHAATAGVISPSRCPRRAPRDFPGRDGQRRRTGLDPSLVRVHLRRPSDLSRTGRAAARTCAGRGSVRRRACPPAYRRARSRRPAPVTSWSRAPRSAPTPARPPCVNRQRSIDG